MTVVSNQGNAIVADSAQMTSANNAISAAVNVVSNAASNALSVASAVSNRLSAYSLGDLIDVSVLQHNRPRCGIGWTTNGFQEFPGGAGSVTSAEANAIARRRHRRTIRFRPGLIPR